MVNKNKRDLMIITLDRASDLYLATYETESKSPRYIDWLKTRLRFFNGYMQETYGQDFKLQDLTVEDGLNYLRSLLEWNRRYVGPPMHTEEDGKLKVQYIHHLGRAIRSKRHSWKALRSGLLRSREVLTIVVYTKILVTGWFLWPPSESSWGLRRLSWNR